ncbi:O-glycosyl hydrolase [Algoriphagus iocasae]|uniref:O-glycosyl hydrolase n=1 Tax=Algoriphagus iocasae TaxID=1836499 RepID=A0A841MNE0_9BACT|nr:glycoside hydrolase [Algoriphagus iocasae]MBB6328990.1 O-glycosyl hydrolase [Algoriphagus iocasae]
MKTNKKIRSESAKALFLVWALSILFACQSSGQENQDQEIPFKSIEVNSQSDLEYQTIEHFGASDAWAVQFVGLWPDQKRNAIAELLFSKEIDSKGKPKGIGLSLWRFNVGAGSAQQGEDSGIKDEWRRAESFMELDGSYNWNRQSGQVWFAQKAKEHQVENLLIFSNSPPVSMTCSGKAFALEGKSNLAEAKHGLFGNYLAQVILGLQEKGLQIDYVSPVNEPQWDWSDGGQEGTPFWNKEISGIVRSLDAALTAKNLETKIDIAEAGKLNYLYEPSDKPDRGSQVKEFFQPESSNYLGNLSHVSQNISGHSYFTTSPFENAVQLRANLNNEISTIPGLKFWMSEYCILGDNEGEINGSGRDLGIDPALYMSRVIHNDLTIANASAWHWWLAISPYNYKDGLVYVDKQEEDGNFYESKMLWALGNFSRFIRPGSKRIAVNVGNENHQSPDLLVSAYRTPASENNLVYVFVNSGIKEVQATIFENKKPVSIQQIYVTSKNKSLESVGLNESEDKVTIPARSIVTVLADL